jgi:hypothetical protein
MPVPDPLLSSPSLIQLASLTADQPHAWLAETLKLPDPPSGPNAAADGATV